jgi:hypothetical protein
LQTICLGWLWTIILLISAFWVARIIGVSHHLLLLDYRILYQGAKTQWYFLNMEERASLPNVSELLLYTVFPQDF